MAMESGKEATGSLTKDAGDQGLARGAAGSEGGAHSDLTDDNVENVRGSEAQGSMEERRETQQVQRPTADGVGEGLTKDAS